MPTSLVRQWRTERPLDLPRTLGPLMRGRADPCTRFVGGVAWRASNTPDGIASVAVTVNGAEVEVRGWGPGAAWMIDGALDLVGENDDWSALDLSSRPALVQVRRRYPGVRLSRTRLVFDSLVPACLEQRVTGQEARSAWRRLVVRYGTPAPGPVPDGLIAPPGPDALLSVPDWDWHLWGVDPRRYRAIRSAAMVAGRLEECVALSADGDHAAAARRLQAVPGIGAWTAAETAVRSLGDPDAVSVGDFHLKNLVGVVLTGAARSTDEEMLALLEPWRGQRARVIRMIELSGVAPPKFGPRFSPNDISRL